MGASEKVYNLLCLSNFKDSPLIFWLAYSLTNRDANPRVTIIKFPQCCLQSLLHLQMTQSGPSIHLPPQINSALRQWNFYFSLSQPKYSNITKSSLAGQRLGKATDSHSSSVQFSHSVMSDFTTHGLQHARLPCPSPTPGAYSNSCPSSQWCHPTISSSFVSLSSHLQSFPASGSFQRSQFFALGGQSIGVSTLTLVLPMNTLDWSPLG